MDQDEDEEEKSTFLPMNMGVVQFKSKMFYRLYFGFFFIILFFYG